MLLFSYIVLFSYVSFLLCCRSAIVLFCMFGRLTGVGCYSTYLDISRGFGFRLPPRFCSAYMHAPLTGILDCFQHVQRGLGPSESTYLFITFPILRRFSSFAPPSSCPISPFPYFAGQSQTRTRKPTHCQGQYYLAILPSKSCLFCRSVLHL